MHLETLEFLIWIQEWVFVIQANDNANLHQIFIHVVQERSTKGFIHQRVLQWPPQCVLDQSRGVFVLWNAPDFLNAETIRLGLSMLAQIEFRHDFFTARATATFPEERYTTA